jgi:hypothetical protein
MSIMAGPLNRRASSIRKIAAPLQGLLAGTAITDDSRLRELLYKENPPSGKAWCFRLQCKEDSAAKRARAKKRSGPEKGPASDE